MCDDRVSRLSTFLSVEVLCLLVFALLLLNFATPTLGFLAAMSGEAPVIFFYIDQFLEALPFVVTALFFYILVTKISVLENRSVVSLSGVQAVSAVAIVVVWLDGSYLHFSGRLVFPLSFAVEVLPIIFVITLCTAWVLLISRISGNILNLSGRFETVYLAVNLVFALSLSVHLFKNVDFLYFFGLRLPLSVSWVIVYAPTLLVSLMSLIVWGVFVSVVREPKRLAFHLGLVLLPVGFVLYAMSLRPLVGYVLTSAIVWGSSYEFFSPPTLSLLMALLATTAFLSSSILLGPKSTGRNPKLIRLSLASAVLAGMSSSPLSILGVLLSLQFLFIGIQPRQSLLATAKHINVTLALTESADSQFSCLLSMSEI